MAKQKNLSPLELKHLRKYIENQTCTIVELSVEMGHDVVTLEKYIESLGGLKNVPSSPTVDELTPEQVRIRESFAKRSGAVMMTEGSSSMIEEMEGSKSFTNPIPIYKPAGKTKKGESHIFRGNKPVNGKSHPYDERRI